MRDPQQGHDPDGVLRYRGRARGGVGRLLGGSSAVMLIVALVACWWLWRDEEVSPQAPPQPLSSASATQDGARISNPQPARPSPAATPRATRRLRAVHVERGRPSDEDGHGEDSGGSASGNEQPEIDAREVINALGAAGETEGIAAFPPPGTNPPKSGIIVPEGFEVPEGYVKHYQTTDDGESLEPILMFSPDYEFLDPAGHPIELPDDMIVPPELAPPGLPIRMLEIPKRALR